MMHRGIQEDEPEEHKNLPEVDHVYNIIWKGEEGERNRRYGDFKMSFLEARVKNKLTKLGPKRPTFTWNDLPSIPAIEPGILDEVFVTHVENPSSFFMVFENELNYGLDNECWRKYLPPLRKGIAALRGISALLTIWDNYQLDSTFLIISQAAFKVKDLVVVKFMEGSSADLDQKGIKSADEDKSTSSDKGTSESIRYQLRRGVVLGVITDRSSGRPLYVVHLLDYGSRVTVSRDCLAPLLEPFQSIAPLAIRCGLSGVSPCGINWSTSATSHLKDLAITNTDFYAEICSNTPGPLTPDKVVLVNLRWERLKDDGRGADEICETLSDDSSLTVWESLTEVLARKQLGLRWNPVPSRPKIMKNIHDMSKNQPVVLKNKGNEQFRLSTNDAGLLTRGHCQFFEFLPLTVLARDLYRLFSLRRNHLSEIYGLTNRFILFTEPSNKIPAVIVSRHNSN